MFNRKIPAKIYCKIHFDEKYDTGMVEFLGIMAYKTFNKFSETNSGKGLWGWNNCESIELDKIYHFLANENFIPVTENFFYRDATTNDLLIHNKGIEVFKYETNNNKSTFCSSMLLKGIYYKNRF